MKKVLFIFFCIILSSCVTLPYNQVFKSSSKINNEDTQAVTDIPCGNSITFDLINVSGKENNDYYMAIRVPEGTMVNNVKLKVNEEMSTLEPVSNPHVDYNLRESKIYKINHRLIEKMASASEFVIGVSGYSSYIEEQCTPTKIKIENVNAKYGIELFKSIIKH